VKRRLRLAFLFLTVGLITMAPSCEGVPDCRKEGCAEGRQCTSPIEGVWICTISGDPSPTPTPFPSPTPPPTTLPGPRDCRHFGCPTHGQVCVEVARDDWQCVTPTPLPTPTPTPQPTPTPTPQPTPTPCNPRVEKVCIKNGVEVALSECNNCASYTSYMERYGYWTRGDPTEDGDAAGAGHPGMWLNFNGPGNLAGMTRKSDCAKVNISNGAAGTPCSACDPPIVTEIIRPCPSPTPSPFPTPTPGPSPSPTPGPGCQIPSSCPALTRWGVSPNPHIQDQHANTVSAPVVGGTVHWDSTPRFGGGSNGGQPCNDEHHVPCTSTVPGCGHVWRQCEDPRGPNWSVDGPATIKHTDGFGIQVRVTGTGKITVQACPKPDAHDHYGVPLSTGPSACSSRFVTVH
jgi:hypothetical protein